MFNIYHRGDMLMWHSRVGLLRSTMDSPQTTFLREHGYARLPMVYRLQQTNTVMAKMKCPICSGTGIQEQTMKGYRRYKCWSCEGEKVVDNPFDLDEEDEIEEEE